MRYRIWILTAAWMMATVCMAAKKFTLVIDAGHGGHDVGAVGVLTNEKTINLNVALAFGRLVETNCPDVKVIYTRKSDVFVKLHTRADIANKNKADLFISIHTNALPKGRISRGLETYTLGMHRANDNLDVAKRENSVILIEKDYKQRYEGFDPRSSESYIMFEFMQDHNMAQSVELAKLVQRRTCAAAGRQNKGVKQAGFLVLRETSMPSCLIELGFISTSDEEQFLNSRTGVNQLALGIYHAFVDYKRKYDGNINVPYKGEVRPEVTIPTIVPMDEAKEKKNVTKRKLSDVADSEPVPADTVPAKVEEQPVDSLPQLEAPVVDSRPLFKVQILASSTKQGSRSSLLKGQTDVDCYEEGGLFKYTVGASTDYNEVLRLRKQLQEKFPQCFIIAFKNGQKMDVRQAIKEFKNKN